MDKQAVRFEIERLLAEQLLGPVQLDETLPARPSDTYLTGILWPRGTALEGSGESIGPTDIANDDSEPVDAGVPGYRAVRPCSCGLSFEVDKAASLVISLGSTARYRPSPKPQQLREKDASSISPGAERIEHEWHREQLRYRLEIPSSESRTAWRTQEFLLPDGSIRSDPAVAVDIRRRVREGSVVVTATLINTAVEAATDTRDSSLLFQAELRVDAALPSGAPAIQPRPSYPFADDEDRRTNLLLYRDAQEYAAGHGVSAEWPEPRDERVEWIATSWLPKATVAGTSPLGHSTLRELREAPDSVFSASTLSDLSRRSTTLASLDQFCSIYESWIQGLTSRTERLDGELRLAADLHIHRCADTVARMRRGVKTLADSEDAWMAFTLANRAMDIQAQFPSKRQQARPLVWRPFQVAFLLLVLPGLVHARDPEARRDTMDLLWFPTGGGKTEAYLAITAFEILFRRIVNPARRESGGTDVLMRYTLRLLTVQQFQRAAALISACEALRRQDPTRLGAAPISLGLYVGGEATPNFLNEGIEKLADEAAGRKPPSTPRQLLECPVCGHTLSSAAYRIDVDRRWMDIACRNEQCSTGAVPLPILTIDEAIYEHPTSLLIATVDKFAQLPRNGRMRRIFGGPGGKPGLIIQDELHLISGPLGSMAGLYEAALDLLCSDGDVRPKIVGSTATIGRAREQVRALFDRDVLQFPPPGLEAADSFFAVKDEKGPSRAYRGVASAGRSPKFALQAVIAALMQAAARLRELAGDESVDPYWTCVAYFNSLRELGGAHVLMQDDVRRQLAVLAARCGATARELEGLPVELSSRVSSREIPEFLKKLNAPLVPLDPNEELPPDSVLASNMISVGVDVPRLGLMVVNGQPKSTAEYIQATSRVGRGLPGLVVTLYNFGRPRDLSHFEHFANYHAALYRSVEATSVTPWAPRARDKALHAVFAAMVRHVLGLSADEDAARFDRAALGVGSVVEYLVRRAKAATAAAPDADVRVELEEIATAWERLAANAGAAGRKFLYWERRAPFGRTSPHLLYSAEEQKPTDAAAMPAPNSLREVEPSTAFVLKRFS